MNLIFQISFINSLEKYCAKSYNYQYYSTVQGKIISTITSYMRSEQNSFLKSNKMIVG
jgi:hypothetical protein